MTLTASEVTILKELGKRDNGAIEYNQLRNIAGLTMRGFRLVTTRMENRNQISRSFGAIMITFGGMQAVAKHEINKARVARGSAPL